jgi:hypothetical protein
MFAVLYKGRTLFKSPTLEECTEFIDDLSQKFYQGEDIDVTEIELEEI